MKHGTCELVEKPLRVRERLQEKCENLIELEYKALPRGRSFDQITINGGGSRDRMENIAISITTQKERIAGLREELRAAVSALDHMLRYLIAQGVINRQQAQLMHSYYAAGHTMSDISEKLHISRSTAYRWQRLCIAAIDTHIDTYPGQNGRI